ncbi:hypothetical protein E2542_SST00778 [Spatholobus suberectus]|nr:hypothetical protein E2542_SST00778 [Spatholobus suberectus]
MWSGPCGDANSVLGTRILFYFSDVGVGGVQGRARVGLAATVFEASGKAKKAPVPCRVSPLEIGWNKGIRKLWLECDSVIAVQMIEQEVPSDHPLSNILISEKRSKAGYLKTGEYWRTLVLSRYELIFKVPLCNLEVVKGWCWDAFDVGVHVLRSIAVPLDGVSGVFCGGPGVA